MTCLATPGVQAVIKVEDFIVFETDLVDRLLRILSRQVSISHGSGFAIIVDLSGIAVGTCTDADIRRFLLKNNRLPVTVAEVAHRDFVFLSSVGDSENQSLEIANIFKGRGWETETPTRLVPVLDEGVPVGVLEFAPDDPKLVALRDRAVVIGLGYVGLTLACTIADTGMETHGIEMDSKKRVRLLSGEDRTGEPGVAGLLSKHLQQNLFVHQSTTNVPQTGPGRGNVFVICVGTPVTENTGLDESFVYSALESIIEVISRKALVVVRSTVAVGTARKIADRIAHEKGWQVGRDFFVASAPERTVEGDALREIRELPQLVAGVTPACTNRAIEFFRTISESIVPMESVEAAELAKLASNAYRDYVFAFSNHLASIARAHSVDINRLVGQINSGYSRSAIPQPSPGVGGPCLTKDSRILEIKSKSPMTSPILAARSRNESFTLELADFLDVEFSISHISAILALGLAFKGVPATPDLRGSPGLQIIDSLIERGYQVLSWDAVADLESSRIAINNPTFLPGAFLMLNNHPANLEKLRGSLVQTTHDHLVIFDPWRLVEKQWLRALNRSRTKFTVMSLSHKWES